MSGLIFPFRKVYVKRPPLVPEAAGQCNLRSIAPGIRYCFAWGSDEEVASRIFGSGIVRASHTTVDGELCDAAFEGVGGDSADVCPFKFGLAAVEFEIGRAGYGAWLTP